MIETAVYDKYVRWCGRTGPRGPSYPIPCREKSPRRAENLRPLREQRHGLEACATKNRSVRNAAIFATTEKRGPEAWPEARDTGIG